MTEVTSGGIRAGQEIRDTQTAARYLAEGQQAESNGDRLEAIEHYEAAFAADPDDAQICFKLAYSLDLVGEEDEAMHLYEQCVQRPNPSLNALLNLAVLYEDRHQYTKAERCIRQVLDTDPNHPRACLFIKDVLASADMVVDEERDHGPTGATTAVDTPVTDFDLSVRTRNALRRMEVRTLGDLLRVTEADLRGYKDIGESSLEEIRGMLAERGMRLGQAIEQQQFAAKQAVYDQLKSDAGPSNESLDRSVAELQLSVRARKALALLNINTIAELCVRTEAELMGVKNFGMTSLLEIKERLNDMGLSLRTLED